MFRIVNMERTTLKKKSGKILVYLVVPYGLANESVSYLSIYFSKLYCS